MADPNQLTDNGGFLGGLTKAIGNPLVQGALGAYFNAISAPRRTSLAGRLGIGGLGGLQAFDTAETLQSKLPLEQAQLQAELGKPALQQSQIGLNQARQMQIGGSPEANKAAAAQMQLQLQGTTDPTQKAILQMLIPGVANGVTKPEKVAELLQKGDVNAATIERDAAQTALARANTGLVGPRAAEIAAQTGAANARTSEAPSTIAKNQAEAAKAGRAEGPKPPGAYAASGREMVYDPAAGTYVDKGAAAGTVPKTPAPLALETQAEKEAQNIWKSHYHLNPWGESYEDFAKKFKAKFMAEHGGGASTLPPHAATGEGLPPDSRPNGDGTWTLPDGSIATPH
jgi:hypothetical protein